jgi:hypothetical protein
LLTAELATEEIASMILKIGLRPAMDADVPEEVLLTAPEGDHLGVQLILKGD